MATALPQPPPMAHHPQSGGDSMSPLVSVLGSKTAKTSPTGVSPFSPPASPHDASPMSSPHGTSAFLDTQGVLGCRASGKSSFSSTSSAPGSPASMCYSPAVRSALRDSCRSSTSSHHSAMLSPHPLGANARQDLEKQQVPARSAGHVASGRGASTHHHTTSCSSTPDDDGEEEEEDMNLKVEEKALSILLYLAGPNCLVSFVILFYTFFALCFTVLLQPFRLCTSSTSFRQQIIGFLAPTLRIQLGFIHSSSDSEAYSAVMLVLVNLVAPLLSFGVAGASWIAAAFWFFNAILGDPDGSDKPKGYNDGRASVMGVRRWWEKWLRRPLR